MTTTASQTLLAISNPYFAKGYELGRLWYFSSVAEREGEPDDTYLLINITFCCESKLHTNPAWLAERIGFLIGMVSGLSIPDAG